MIGISKPLSAALLVLAFALGLGSIAILAGWPLGMLRIVSPRWPITTILFWDAALSLVFFLQHSGMIRRPFRRWLARIVDPRYHAAIYTIASGLALGAVVLLWQPSGALVFELTGPARLLAQGAAVAGLGLFVWGARSLRPFDVLGLQPLLAHLRSRPEPTPAFVARGPYRWVRHPLYLAVLILIWSSPEMTVDRLLFCVLWTGWIILGTLLEEADLLTDFGESYRAYCRDVPMLLPWPWHRKPDRQE